MSNALNAPLVIGQLCVSRYRGHARESVTILAADRAIHGRRSFLRALGWICRVVRSGIGTLEPRRSDNEELTVHYESGANQVLDGCVSLESQRDSATVQQNKTPTGFRHQTMCTRRSSTTPRRSSSCMQALVGLAVRVWGPGSRTGSAPRARACPHTWSCSRAHSEARAQAFGAPPFCQVSIRAFSSARAAIRCCSCRARKVTPSRIDGG